MGLSLRETMTVPLSFLRDLIAIQQIKADGFEWQRPGAEDAELFKILSMQ